MDMLTSEREPTSAVVDRIGGQQTQKNRFRRDPNDGFDTVLRLHLLTVLAQLRTATTHRAPPRITKWENRTMYPF